MCFLSFAFIWLEDTWVPLHSAHYTDTTLKVRAWGRGKRLSLMPCMYIDAPLGGYTCVMSYLALDRANAGVRLDDQTSPVPFVLVFMQWMSLHGYQLFSVIIPPPSLPPRPFSSSPYPHPFSPPTFHPFSSSPHPHPFFSSSLLPPLPPPHLPISSQCNPSTLYLVL